MLQRIPSLALSSPPLLMYDLLPGPMQDQEQLRRQLQDTAVSNYRSFIDTTQCLSDLRSQLQAAVERLDALDADLPQLSSVAERFRREAADIQARRAANRQLYSAYDQRSAAAAAAVA